VRGVATERLVNLTLSEQGTTYLSGDGADDYQIICQFEEAGIAFQKLGFHSRPYPQRRNSEFVPGLSIIDALCYVGIEGTLELLKRPEMTHD
jgi:WbqC-like protein family